jgi:hypothetical protein
MMEVGGAPPSGTASSSVAARVGGALASSHPPANAPIVSAARIVRRVFFDAVVVIGSPLCGRRNARGTWV